jgi:beta-mannosidase
MNLQSLNGNWQFRQTGTEEWYPAQVPGGVHTDLLALGRIPDPFVGDNEKHVQWVAESDWEYRYYFSCGSALQDEEKIWLVCDGLDTLATVNLNGQELGRTANMFRQYRWDVKPILKAGQADLNELVIAFGSPVKYVTEKQAIRKLDGVPQAIAGGPWLRKAPSHFGWDWGPQLPPIGIWKDIRLEGRSLAYLAEVQLRQAHHQDTVTLSVPVRVESWNPAALEARVKVTGPGGETIEKSAPIASGGQATVELEIARPQIWWPNGYGEQPLYEVEVTLAQAETGKLVDRKGYRVGLRTLELRQQPDHWGKSFTFVVNGLPIFAKGADWIPADSFPTRVTAEHLEYLIRAAVETHQNMLRVWGGGFYEDERFYDLCDRYGVLVWQDFLFACSSYPLYDSDFLENVRNEVVENVRRLRHRASLALWCGNNEIEQGWVEWGFDRPETQDLKAAYDQFFHKTLAEWCAAEDPITPYWPSSPSSDTPFEDPNGQQQGDAHYWAVWHGGKPFTAYRDQFPRFMSEFGFQALPPLPTIATFADEADWNMTSYVMEQHQKNNRGNTLMVNQMLDSFRLPKDFESLVYLSMVLQAEGIRYGVEHWRRHMDRVSGTLYWQLNDCWPVASWSSLDYFGRWKALHYAARRFYAPIMLSVEDTGTEQAIYVTSDLREEWSGTVRWSLETLAGTRLESGQEEVTASGLGTTLVRKLNFADRVSDTNRREVVFVAELWQEHGLVGRQVTTFAPTKHLSLAAPDIRASLHREQGGLFITLRANSLARLVEVTLTGKEVIFSDNYFDLPANRETVVSARLPEGWSLEQARSALRIRSVYDSFATAVALESGVR